MCTKIGADEVANFAPVRCQFWELSGGQILHQLACNLSRGCQVLAVCRLSPFRSVIPAIINGAEAVRGVLFWFQKNHPSASVRDKMQIIFLSFHLFGSVALPRPKSDKKTLFFRGYLKNRPVGFSEVPPPVPREGVKKAGPGGVGRPSPSCHLSINPE